VEIWNLPSAELAGFAATIAPPLALGPLELSDGDQVLGFVCTADGADPGRDITDLGSWRAFLDRA
jgi:allophanate hydrolase